MCAHINTGIYEQCGVRINFPRSPPDFDPEKINGLFQVTANTSGFPFAKMTAKKGKKASQGQTDRLWSEKKQQQQQLDRADLES